ncbi:hypothetical protein Tco_1549568 [Tanacetum coccineum]
MLQTRTGLPGLEARNWSRTLFDHRMPSFNSIKGNSLGSRFTGYLLLTFLILITLISSGSRRLLKDRLSSDGESAASLVSVAVKKYWGTSEGSI